MNTLLLFAIILNLLCIGYGFWLLESLSRTNRLMRREAMRLAAMADKLERQLDEAR